MCFAPQRRALFRHLNFRKWSETASEWHAMCHAMFCIKCHVPWCFAAIILQCFAANVIHVPWCFAAFILQCFAGFRLCSACHVVQQCFGVHVLQHLSYFQTAHQHVYTSYFHTILWLSVTNEQTISCHEQALNLKNWNFRAKRLSVGRAVVLQHVHLTAAISPSSAFEIWSSCVKISALPRCWRRRAHG